MTYDERERLENGLALCLAVGVVGIFVFSTIAIGPQGTLAVITVAALAGAYRIRRKLKADEAEMTRKFLEAQKQAAEGR